MRVRIRSHVEYLPSEIASGEGPFEFEVLQPGDTRRNPVTMCDLGAYYLLVMPKGIGHMADSTVDAWWVMRQDCEILPD